MHKTFEKIKFTHYFVSYYLKSEHKEKFHFLRYRAHFKCEPDTTFSVHIKHNSKYIWPLFFF